MEDIRENGRILTNSIQKIHPSAVKKNALFKSGSIIVATSATIGEHALVLVDCLANQRFTCLTVKDEYKNKVDNMFLFYYMFNVDEWCKTHTAQGNFPGVDMSQFPSVLIPLPSIEEQKRIATILDRFNSLTTDITAGLPAEIEARRKQYEYYRDQLLTFKQKA
jgi:type I restriction enzyme S subunit